MPAERGRERAPRVTEREDAGRGIVGIRAKRGSRTGRRRSEQEQGGLIPRSDGQTLALEDREGCADRRAEVIIGATAQREQIGAVVGAVARDGAVGLHQRGEEVRRRDGLGADGFRQGAAHGTLDDLGPGQKLQEQPMIVGGVLAETAVRTDEFGALLGELRHSLPIGTEQAGAISPEDRSGLQADRFGDAMVVLLGKRVSEMETDAARGGVGQAGDQRQAFVGRGRVVPEGLHRERDRDQTEGGFLAAHPVGSAVRRIARHPVLERGPEELDVAIVAVAQPGADEREGEAEAGKFPDALDVIGTRIAEAGPVGVRVRRMTGQDAAGPAVRTTDLDELMREDPGISAGEGIGFRDRRVTGGDGPGFERRREVRSVEERDREPRRGLTPSRGVEADGEILPRAPRRTPFPESELTLARPPSATSEPSRAEVMEEREEHLKAGGLSR